MRAYTSGPAPPYAGRTAYGGGRRLARSDTPALVHLPFQGRVRLFEAVIFDLQHLDDASHQVSLGKADVGAGRVAAEWSGCSGRRRGGGRGSGLHSAVKASWLQARKAFGSS